MLAIDKELAARGRNLYNRPMHFNQLLHGAFTGPLKNVFPVEYTNQSGFEGELLLAKTAAWYTKVFGDRICFNSMFGYAPFQLGEKIWNVRAPFIFGNVPWTVSRQVNSPTDRYAAQINVLDEVEGLTQDIVDAASEEALAQFEAFYTAMHRGLAWRLLLPGSSLLKSAAAHYNACTADTLYGKFNSACGNAQQAVEKTFKGLLNIGSTPYPKSSGSDCLVVLAGILEHEHSIALSPAFIAQASCLPSVQEEAAKTRKEALQANHAVLNLLNELALHPDAQTLLRSVSY